MQLDRNTSCGFFMHSPGSVFSHSRMEINSHYNHVNSDDLNKNSSPALKQRNVAFSNSHTNDSTNNQAPMLVSSIMREQHFQQQIMHLKQQQQLQQQILVQQFQQKQQQLTEQHEKQLQLHIKEYLEQQKKEEEQQQAAKERKEQEKLESLKKKDKHEQSAVASSAVKQKLQKTILKKQQREAAAHSANTSPSNVQNWHPLIGKYGDDFQLRRTASEPNLKLRSIIKQKVYERRSSPLLRRRDKGPLIGKRRSPLTNSSCNTTDSGPTSPSSGIVVLARSSGDSTPIQEEPDGSQYNASTSQGSMSDLTLYQSPSMPNISLGRPPVPASSSNDNATTTVSEAQIRAMAAARLGAPLTSNSLYGPLPFYPSLPVIEGEFTPPTSPVFVSPSNKDRSAPSLSQTIPGQYPVPGAGITDAQVAQAKLHRSGHRPLSRTQSAPLPLGHPVLSPGNQMTQQQQEQYLRKKSMFDPKSLKQHLRNTVLTRSNSKNHVENVEEETEAAIAQEMKDEMETMTIPEDHSKSQQPEVIDLTDKKELSGLAKQQRERESFLQQQRDIMAPHNALTATDVPPFTSRYPHTIRPLARALSSPLVNLSATGTPQESHTPQKRSVYTTGVVYDNVMLRHQCTCGNNSNHPEHGGRLQSIWARFQETGLLARCERVRSRKASLEELKSVHSEAHVLLFGTNPLNRQKLGDDQLSELPIKNFVMLPCGGIGVDSDTMWSEAHTAAAARMAAGCVTELALKVAIGEVKNGFAVVRPPGHHAEQSQAMGFCFFNSVAVAAKQLQERLKLERIMIVDWDVHHGNGIQQAFYDDNHVLYLSLHRHDNSNFFPGTGDPQEVGVDNGVGFNVNIAWSGGLNPPLGDAEYLAAFRTIVLPITRAYDPEIILVACGFDAAYGHEAPLGGYQVTPACFGYLTQQLMLACQGKVVLALEGGYNLAAICDASQHCLMSLLGDEIAPLKDEELRRKPCHNAVETLHRIAAVQAAHWPCVKDTIHTIEYSALEFQQKDKEEADTVSALASLSVVGNATSPIGSTNACSSDSVDEPMEQDQDK